MKVIILAAAMAVACTSFVNAAEVKNDTTAPVVKAQTMSDADLDKVTAAGTPSEPGFGVNPTSCQAGGTCGDPPFNNGAFSQANGNTNGRVTPGSGVCTTAASGRC
jgi:hypothetical protein